MSCRVCDTKRVTRPVAAAGRSADPCDAGDGCVTGVDDMGLDDQTNHRPLDDEKDTEGHRLSSNDDETVVDDKDTEGHRLASNDDETVVDDKDTEE